ncbi:hypothetical protein CALCODRAFT_405442, partial [Calocera cornea HHB12733]
IVCDNCKKPGHSRADCWSKGGGKEGQGPRSKGKKKKSDHANQADDTNDNLLDAAYHVTPGSGFTHQDWLLDSGTTSHI